MNSNAEVKIQKKYISFSVPIKKENNDDNNEIITYKITFTDTCRFIRSRLSDLVDNLSEINNKNCKKCMERKSIKSECIFIGIKNNRLNYRCKECCEKFAKSVNEIYEKFPNTYKFCNGDLNKFVLLLRKGIYPYEYIDGWEKFNDKSLPPKKYFYNELNLEDVNDKDYAHDEKVWEVFEIKNLGEYHDFYVQSDTFLLADVFEKLRYKCIEINGLNPFYFYSAPGLAWQACLKKTGIKLELLTDYNMLFIDG